MDPTQPTPETPQSITPPETVGGPVGPIGPKKTNGLAIAGFVLAFLIPLIGLILSIIGLAKAKNYHGNGKGLSIAGIVISIFMMIVGTVVALGLLAAIGKRVEEANKQDATSSSSTSKVQSKSDTITLGSVYTEKSGAYSLKLPEGWKTIQSEGSRNFSSLPSGGSDYVSSASLDVSKLFPEETLADYVKTETDSIVKYSGGTIKSEADVTINGMMGHELVAHKDSGGNISESYTVILLKGDTIYRLSYTTSTERNASYLPVFKQSAQSLVVK